MAALICGLCSEGGLDEFLERKASQPGQALAVQAKLDACAQMASAVGHLHAGGILHRDIAARNVLVAEYVESGPGNAGHIVW